VAAIQNFKCPVSGKTLMQYKGNIVYKKCRYCSKKHKRKIYHELSITYKECGDVK
jgi:hypothetical protein